MVDRYSSAKFIPPCRPYVAMVDQYLTDIHDARRSNPYTQCAAGPYPFGQIPRTFYELNGSLGIQLPLYQFPRGGRVDPGTVAYSKLPESVVKYPLGRGEYIFVRRHW